MCDISNQLLLISYVVIVDFVRLSSYCPSSQWQGPVMATMDIALLSSLCRPVESHSGARENIIAGFYSPIQAS